MSEKSKIFVAYWDVEGFEFVMDITSYERKRLLADISGKELDNESMIDFNALLLRARFNPQRFPEIWTFSTVDSLDEKTIKQFAETHPQELADLIRSNGRCVFSTPKNKRTID